MSQATSNHGQGGVLLRSVPPAHPKETPPMPAQRFTMPAAVHLFLLRGGEVLLLRRYQTGYEDGSYSVIAGHLDGAEEVISAAIREAREEASITLAPEAVRVVGVMH